MDPNSGKIIWDISDAEAAKHGLVPIPEDQVEAVQHMNRHERRKWAAMQRKGKR